jgi:hypothetical protein
MNGDLYYPITMSSGQIASDEYFWSKYELTTLVLHLLRSSFSTSSIQEVCPSLSYSHVPGNMASPNWEALSSIWEGWIITTRHWWSVAWIWSQFMQCHNKFQAMVHED